MLKEWKWNVRGSEEDGVRLFEDHLLWYHQVWPDWSGSVARKQSYQDFMENGSPFGGVPEDILSAVRVAIDGQ